MIQMAVCDDEKEDRGRLCNLIQTYMCGTDMEYELTEFESGEQLVEQDREFQLLFLDILMSQKDGIQAGAEIKRKNPDTLIIYISNLDDQISVAVNRIHSYGYLVKPVNREELYLLMEDALECVMERIKETKVVFHREDGKPIALAVKDIYYFEYNSRRVKIVTTDKVFDRVKGKIGEIAEQMRPYGFVFSHQSFVVNLHHVDRIKDRFLAVYLAQKRAAMVRRKMIEVLKEAVDEGGKMGRRRRNG